MNDDSFKSIDTLPINSRRDDILTAVDNNQVTIITAETGAGKSTQVPQYLAEHGYRKIIVTQPRILAARNLSDRVRQEYSWRLGVDATNLVGYRTAHERDDSAENVILYCTDGLQLVLELTGSGIREKQVLILDEVHEWNENMEVLVAWAKKRCQEDPYFKVVLMSATIESDSLAAYYNAPQPISVAGRSFPVEQRHAEDLVAEISGLLQTRTCNMLVFLPGKAEIEAVATAIASVAGNKVPIIPLHSQLEPEQQQLAFASYPNGKVVLATNIAQTSITVEDIDVVIDSGLERRAEVRSGVEGLFIAEISRADCLQRAGRAGRTKPGLYILAQLDGLPCSLLTERADYGIPEIMRKHIDRLVLRLANIGIDIEDLDFYHSPSRKSIKFATYTLVSLGALTANKQVTDIGREMERYPIESMYARMLVEVRQFPAELQAKLAAIIAIQEVGGIVKGGPRYSGWRKYTHQTRSDLVAQFDVFLMLDSIDLADHEELGIITKNVDKAQDIADRLYHELGLHNPVLSAVTEQEMPDLLRCIVAGQLHQLWSVDAHGVATHLSTKREREVSSTTVVKHAALVAGTPFDLQVPTQAGLETLHLVNDITAVEPAWLKELAPEAFRLSPGKTYYDHRQGTLATTTLLKFNGQAFEATSSPLLEHTADNKRLFVNLYSKWALSQLEEERRTLQHANLRKLPVITLEQVQQRVRYLADGAVSVLELPKKQRIDLAKVARLETYLGDDVIADLNKSNVKRRRTLFNGHHLHKPNFHKRTRKHRGN